MELYPWYLSFISRNILFLLTITLKYTLFPLNYHIFEKNMFPKKTKSLFSKQKAYRVIIAKKNLITKVNATYQFNLLLKKTIAEMKSLEKQNEYLFMEDGTRAKKFKLTFGMLKCKKRLQILEHNHWPSNNTYLNQIHFEICRLVEKNVY